jgi:hypothetical protein
MGKGYKTKHKALAASQSGGTKGDDRLEGKQAMKNKSTVTY